MAVNPFPGFVGLGDIQDEKLRAMLGQLERWAKTVSVYDEDAMGAEPIIAKWGDGQAQVDEVRMDASTNSLQIMTNEHHEVHAGSHYFVISYQGLTINKVLDFTWLMPDTTKWIHWDWNISTESETLWQLYETAVATNPLANAVTPYNSNRNSSNTSGATMKFEVHANLAAANVDTDVSGATLIQSGISGSGKEAGEEMRGHEVIMKQNTLYCFRVTATAAGFINYSMQWYEHTDKH